MVKRRNWLVKKIDISSFLCVAALVILTLPRFADSISPSFSVLVNFLKVCAAVCAIVLFVTKKPKLSKFSKIFILYFIYIFAVTLFNNVDPVTALKTYGLNAAVLFLVEVILSSKMDKRIIVFFTNYFLILLGLNFVQVCIYELSNTIGQAYILGIDNRFVLYTLLTVVGCYYIEDKKTRLCKKYLAYALGFLSVLLTWSVAAVCILGLIIVASIYFEKKKIRINLNAKIIGLVILIASAALVIFKFHEAFWPVIENAIHKNSSLSYRTYIWDVGIDALKENPINLIFGFGFFDVSGVLSVIPFAAAHVIHFHNILVEVLFSGGIIGLALYLGGLFFVGNNLDQLKKKDKALGNQLVLVFLGLLTLMAFDVFEYYQAYYVMLALLYYAPLRLESKNNKSVIKNEKRN